MPVEQILSAAQEASFKDILDTFFIILEFPAVTLLTAMLLEIILPIKATWRLSSLSPIFAFMAKKVNRKENSMGQTVFSSIFLPVFLVTISVLVILFLRLLVNYDPIISLLILPFLLESKPILCTVLQVKRSLENDNKVGARKYLQTRMLRDCSNLSAMGINKAMSESVTMSMFANWFAIIVWYMLLGIEGAVMMQLVAVMNRSFSFKEKHNELFGSFIYKFEQALLIPAFVALFCMMFFSLSFVRIMKNIKLNFIANSYSVSCLTMDLLGLFSNTKMGGPRYYGSNLMRLPTLGGVNDPTEKTPLKIYNKIRFCGILFVCICVVFKIFFYSAV